MSLKMLSFVFGLWNIELYFSLKKRVLAWIGQDNDPSQTIIQKWITINFKKSDGLPWYNISLWLVYYIFIVKVSYWEFSSGLCKTGRNVGPENY